MSAQEGDEIRTSDIYFIKCDPNWLSYLLGTIHIYFKLCLYIYSGNIIYKEKKRALQRLIPGFATKYNLLISY